MMITQHNLKSADTADKFIQKTLYDWIILDSSDCNDYEFTT